LVFAINNTSGNPTPIIHNLTPNSATVGAGGFTLTINGTNFVTSSIVLWNGAARPTTFIDSDHLTATISAADVAAVRIASVAVVNPTPGGGISSNSQPFIVRGPLYLAQIELSLVVVKAQPCNDVEPDNDFSDTAPLLAPIPQTCIGPFDKTPRGT